MNTHGQTPDTPLEAIARVTSAPAVEQSERLAVGGMDNHVSQPTTGQFVVNGLIILTNFVQVRKGVGNRSGQNLANKGTPAVYIHVLNSGRGARIQCPTGFRSFAWESKLDGRFFLVCLL